MVAGVLVFSCIFGFGARCEAKKQDFQYWMTESVSFKLSDEFKLSLSKESYFEDDASHGYYDETDLGLIYSGLAQWLDVSLQFKHVLTERNNKWKREERPHLNAFVKFKCADLDFNNRSRIEYRIRQGADDVWRFRDLLTIALPIKWTRFQIQPYVADEVLLDLDTGVWWNENRGYLGFKFKINKYLSGAIYYMGRSLNANRDWTYSNNVGTRLSLSF